MLRKVDSYRPSAEQDDDFVPGFLTSKGALAYFIYNYVFGKSRKHVTPNMNEPCGVMFIYL